MNNVNQPAMPMILDMNDPSSIRLGLTKREYFTCAAMSALITHYGNYHEPNRIRAQSYKIADVMLKEGTNE